MLAAGSAILLAMCTVAPVRARAPPPRIEKALTKWLNLVSAAQARRTPALSSEMEAELNRRGLIDQAARLGLSRVTAGLGPAEREGATAALSARVAAIDRDNLAYVKSVLPADGWFRRSRDGEIAATRAWLIVHHAEDWDFKRDVLARMAALLASGEVVASNYALLHDRIAMHDGKPQRYGSQLDCRDGRMRLHAVEDRQRLDELRASVGLEPIAAYLRDMEDKPC